MKDTKKETKKLIDDYDYLYNAASATEFTGLIPSLPQNEAELESYNNIWKFLPSIRPETSDRPHTHKDTQA